MLSKLHKVPSHLLLTTQSSPSLRSQDSPGELLEVHPFFFFFQFLVVSGRKEQIEKKKENQSERKGGKEGRERTNILDADVGGVEAV